MPRTKTTNKITNKRSARPVKSSKKANNSRNQKIATNHSYVCQICGHRKKSDDLIPAELVRNSLLSTIKKKYPDWDPKGYICKEDLNNFRNEHIETLLKLDRGELNKINREVVKSIKQQELVSENVDAEFEKDLSFGERLSDKIALFGGSWAFIISFIIALALWMIINTVILVTKPFDPYPFILLNLVLSTLAAIQAPIIMMSQNRQEAKDRLRSENDYKVNMKAELEIQHLNEKLDELSRHQWRRLMEIQQIQMDMMQELKERR